MLAILSEAQRDVSHCLEICLNVAQVVEKPLTHQNLTV